jgi:O-antigen ligase
VEYLIGFLVVGLLFVVLTKMALLSFLAGSLVYLLYRNRKNGPVLILFGTALLLGTVFLGYKILNSEAFHQVVDLGGIHFETIPKTYSNSVNNRLILWRASWEVLSQGNHWMTGFSPEQLQLVLDQQVAVHNGYLTTQHLNPHNQFLYLVLKYGIPGVLTFIFLWYRIFRSALIQKNAYWLGLWSFVFICCFTEVYLDRELGIQLFILFFFLSSPKPGGNPQIPT